MDNQEAKFILRAYRASGADAADPAFGDALAQARLDPALSRWLEQEQALDNAVARKLKAIAPPPGLRETLLAGGRASRRSSRGRYSLPTWLALAACVAVVLGLAFAWPAYRAGAERERLASLVIEDTLHAAHGSSGAESSKLQSYLETTTGKLTGAPMPVALNRLETTGCRTLSLGGHELAEVCFARAGKEYHFYVTTRLGGSAKPKFTEHDGIVAATWSDAGNSYILATTSGVEALKSLL